MMQIMGDSRIQALDSDLPRCKVTACGANRMQEPSSNVPESGASSGKAAVCITGEAKTRLPISMKDLFHGLVWPAAAGNVGWAFFTLWVREASFQSSTLARLAALSVLAFYLGFDWKRKGSELDSLKTWYWIGDAFHVAAIVWLAIAVQERSRNLTLPLAVVFVVTIVFHIIGAWEPAGLKDCYFLKRISMAAISGAGLGILLGLRCWFGPEFLWYLPISMGVVLVFWIGFRARYMDRIYSESRGMAKAPECRVITGLTLTAGSL